MLFFEDIFPILSLIAFLSFILRKGLYSSAKNEEILYLGICSVLFFFSRARQNRKSSHNRVSQFQRIPHFHSLFSLPPSHIFFQCELNSTTCFPPIIWLEFLCQFIGSPSISPWCVLQTTVLQIHYFLGFRNEMQLREASAEDW